MSTKARLVNAWLTHSRVDLIVFVLVPGVHLALVHLWSVPVLLQGVAADKRPGLYGAAAIVVSLTGTLASVSIAQYLNGKGQRVRLLKQRFPEQLGRTWKGVFLGSIFAAVLFLAAYAADVRYPGATPATSTTAAVPSVTGETVGLWLFEAGAVLALLGLVRLAVLFGELIDLIVLDDVEPLDAEPVADVFNDDFFTAEPPRSRRARAS